MRRKMPGPFWSRAFLYARGRQRRLQVIGYIFSHIFQMFALVDKIPGMVDRFSGWICI